VWEFLTNQSVADIIMSYEDPTEACRAVISEAYRYTRRPPLTAPPHAERARCGFCCGRLWLQYDSRTDDITMILAFVDVAEEEAAAASKAEAGRSLSRTGSAGGISAGLAVVLAGGESRPVRRVLSYRRTNTHRTPPSHPIGPRPHTPRKPC
jgi:hypothetical protein